MSGLCGECTMCCRVFAIPLLQKPAGAWCTHCDIGKGCKIYESRPDVCIDFECLWLQSHGESGNPMPIELRPDKCKVMFSGTTNPEVVNALTMPGMTNALQNPAVRKVISILVKGGVAVATGVLSARRMILIDSEGEHEVEMSEPDAKGIQWGKKWPKKYMKS